MTHEELLAAIEYDPETGIITRKITTTYRSKTGVKGGGVDDRGYGQIWVLGKHYRVHRLAWFYMKGEWPGLVDHINGNKSDNRWSNLRLADKSLNAANQRQKASRKLPKGVYQYPYQYGGRPFAQIRVKNLVIMLGKFDTVAEAKAAYDEAALKHFGEFANLEPSTTIAKASTPKRVKAAGPRRKG